MNTRPPETHLTDEPAVQGVLTQAGARPGTPVEVKRRDETVTVGAIPASAQVAMPVSADNLHEQAGASRRNVLVGAQDAARRVWRRPPGLNGNMVATEPMIARFADLAGVSARTWCNRATRAIAIDVGAPLTGDVLLAQLANVIVTRLRGADPAIVAAYRQIADPEEAQRRANEGWLVIAGALGVELNPASPNSAGHVATLRPELESDRANPDYLEGGSGPWINHIGNTTHICRLSRGFGARFAAVTFHTPVQPYGL